MGAMRIFTDANFNEYAIPEEQKPLRQAGHKALWEYGPSGVEKGWLVTWDSYVILGQPSGGLETIREQFNQIDTTGEAMQAYRDFQGFECQLCGHLFFAGHVCSV
jgi:hypothetical protein